MRQVTFPHPMNCIHIYPDGREERVRYGQYEGINIVTENGWPSDRTRILIVPSYYIEEVTKEDGTRVIFDKPFMLIEKKEYGDGSERIAKRTF